MHSSYLSLFIVMLAILNPIGNAAIFVGMTQGYAKKDLVAEVIKATVAICMVLLLTVWLGHELLQLFGISVNSFAIAGGVVVFLIGLSMVQAKSHTHSYGQHDKHSDLAHKESIAVVPLTIPIVAGPGAISAVIMHANLFPTIAQRGIESLLMLLLALIVGGTLWLAPTVARLLGPAGMKVVTRIMGLIICAIAVQMILGALLKVFHIVS